MTMTAPKSDTRQTILRLLSVMASAKEINQYLKRFSQLDAKRFAVVSLDEALLTDELEAIASSLSFLQDVGLTPVVLLGAGPRLEAELATADGKTAAGSGESLTTPEALARLRRTFQQLNLRLVETLQQGGARATSIIGGVFEADYADREALGLLGKVSGVNLAPIESSLQAGSIPVISSLGETAGGQILKIDSGCAIEEMVQVLQPFKVIFLTADGGLVGPTGRVVDSINLSTEYEQLSRQPALKGSISFTLGRMKDMLDRLPLESSIAITSPAHLANELFTHKGSGTLVRRGESVLRASSWDELDLKQMRALIESSFGRRLVEDYFETTRLHRAYVSENYRAAVIVTEEDGIPYLDKFAVLDDAQGEGLGRAVWKIMRDETPRLFWRSRHNNQVNIFYYAQSDGCFKQEKWKVFWYGLNDFDEIQQCVNHCAERRQTLA